MGMVSAFWWPQTGQVMVDWRIIVLSISNSYIDCRGKDSEKMAADGKYPCCRALNFCWNLPCRDIKFYFTLPLFRNKVKKFITAIIAILYLATSSGATIHLHYCMGKLADWGVSHNQSDTCFKCGMEKSKKADKSCCRDEHKFIKNTSAQKPVENQIQLLQLLSVSLPVSFVELPAFVISSVAESNPVSHAPPRTPSVAIYILKRSFLI